MLMKKVVTESGQPYYVMYENSFDDKELVVYTESHMEKIREQIRTEQDAQENGVGDKGAVRTEKAMGKDEENLLDM